MRTRSPRPRPWSIAAFYLTFSSAVSLEDLVVWVPCARLRSDASVVSHQFSKDSELVLFKLAAAFHLIALPAVRPRPCLSVQTFTRASVSELR